MAFPALVVLAAEPLYVLVDTAVVGHLGRVPLASLAIGGGVLSVTAWLGVVLAYGTTGRSARRFGAGERAAAVEEGVQASWLALSAGFAILVAGQLFAGPITCPGAESTRLGSTLVTEDGWVVRTFARSPARLRRSAELGQRQSPAAGSWPATSRSRRGGEE